MNSRVTGEGDKVVKKVTIAIFGNKNRIMSIDMKSKIVLDVGSKSVKVGGDKIQSKVY